MKKIYAAVLALTLAGAASAEAPDAPMPASLITRHDALQLATAAVESCAGRGEHAVARILDAQGHLRALLSDDSAPAIGLVSSAGKAQAVLDFHASTAELAERLKTDPAFAAGPGKDERYFLHPGALPIYRNGEFVAVIAVGGGHAIDEDCAKDALKTLAWARSTK